MKIKIKALLMPSTLEGLKDGTSNKSDWQMCDLCLSPSHPCSRLSHANVRC